MKYVKSWAEKGLTKGIYFKLSLRWRTFGSNPEGINISSFSQTILNSSISAQHKINYQKLTNEHFKSSPRFKKNLLLWTDLRVAAAALEFINLF